MLPAFVQPLGFWPVTAIELVLGGLVIVGIKERWINEALKNTLARKGNGGLCGKLFGTTRWYRRYDAICHGILSGLLVR